MTYIVMLLWVGLGVLGFYFTADFNHLAAYFLSLTGFIMSYMFGESYRKSKDTSIFMKGTTSKRELITYATVIMWTVIGVWGIIKTQDLMALSAYFAALTPFVGAYVIGESMKAEDGSKKDDDVAPQQLNS
jgi:hypothetical protein